MNGSPIGEESINVDWTSDDELDILPEIIEASSSDSDVTKQFLCMGFPKDLVLKAIEDNGEENTDAILNTLLTDSSLSGSPPPQLFPVNSYPSSPEYDETLLSDISDMDGWSENEILELADSKSERHKMLLSLEKTGSLTEEEKKLLALANMGYPIEEASIAIERCGPEASVELLTDFICAAQVSREEDCYFKEDIKPKHFYIGSSSSSKKRKFKETFKKNITNGEEEPIRLPNPMIGFGTPSHHPETISRFIPDSAVGPPYFYYENVALAPKGVWDTISRFLYEIQPEFVDSKYFSATARKRGYIHNLPIENRFPIVPLPPLTIHQAFPLTRRWWPKWDPRDKMNCIQTVCGSAKLTERIRRALERFNGEEPPESVQKYVLEQCRKWNLVWVGRNKVAPLEPDEVEMLLGFPRNHTRGGGISRTDRYKSLGNSFQVDTVAYHLSVLKERYPNGINMLSLFSGIGGAEVALHRLGIKLKNVVSVEKSSVNRDIVRSWWDQTNQQGTLIDFEDVQALDGNRIEEIMRKIGGFDLVVGGSPCNNLAGSNRVSRDGLEGRESSLFYDYFRILDLVKAIMGRRV